MKTSLAHQLTRSQNTPLIFVVRVILLPLYLLYLLVVTTRNALYDAGLVSTTKVDVPVTSIGNLTVGGTGKTPLVIALAQRAVAAGKRVAIVARGYGAVADAAGNTDEVALMAARVPQAEVVMSPNKTVGAREAASRGVDLILVDDGFQHRRLERDLDVLVVDATAPISNGYVVPMGGLREPPSGIGRADVMVLTHHESLTPEDIEGVVASLSAYRRDIPIVRATHTPIGVRPVAGGELRPVESLAGQDVFLFCGIASPAGFRRTVEGLGAHVTGGAGFADHHDFTASSIAEVRAEARTALLVCTEKDAAKVAAIPGTEDVLCVVIDMVLDDELPPIPGLDG